MVETVLPDGDGCCIGAERNDCGDGSSPCDERVDFHRTDRTDKLRKVNLSTGELWAAARNIRPVKMASCELLLKTN